MELLNIESLLSIKRRKTARKQKTREGRGEAEVEADKCKDDGFTSLSYPVPQCLQAVAKHGSAHEHCIPPTFPGHNQNSGNITLSARRTLKPLEGSTVIPGEVEAFHFHSSPFSTIDSALQAAQSFPFNGMANSNNNINRTSTQPMTINHIHMNIVRFDLPVASNYRARPFSIEELNAANAADSISILKSFWRNKATRAFPMNNSFEFSGVQNPTTSYCTARQIEPLQFYQANPHLADYTGQHYSISNASNQCNCVDNSSHYEQARIFDGFQQWRQQMEKYFKSCCFLYCSTDSFSSPGSIDTLINYLYSMPYRPTLMAIALTNCVTIFYVQGLTRLSPIASEKAKPVDHVAKPI